MPQGVESWGDQHIDGPRASKVGEDWSPWRLRLWLAVRVPAFAFLPSTY